MTARKLTDFRVLSFDCYGTLIDWETGLLKALGDLVTACERRRGSAMKPDEVLQTFARQESSQQARTPRLLYRDLLARVYARMAEEWQLEVEDADCRSFARSVADWPAFADSAPALHYLGRHYRLVILSNVDNLSFKASARQLGVTFDRICTAEDIGSYKPSDANFEYLIQCVEDLGYHRTDILHTAESLFHDHIPANRWNLASCRIHRRHAKKGFGATAEPARMPQWSFCFTGMQQMADAHRLELKAKAAGRPSE